jgi:hypothetical protein
LEQWVGDSETDSETASRDSETASRDSETASRDSETAGTTHGDTGTAGSVEVSQCENGFTKPSPHWDNEPTETNHWDTGGDHSDNHSDRSNHSDTEPSPRQAVPEPGPEAAPRPKSPPFLKLDLREMEGFARLKLTGPEVHVYLALRRFDHVDSRGETKGLVWPSIATLAARTGKGRTQVKKALRGLEKKGVIERLTAPWQGCSNQWKIHYAWLYGEEADPAGAGDTVDPPGRDPDQGVVGNPTRRWSVSRPQKESGKDPESLSPGLESPGGVAASHVADSTSRERENSESRPRKCSLVPALTQPPASPEPPDGGTTSPKRTPSPAPTEPSPASAAALLSEPERRAVETALTQEGCTLRQTEALLLQYTPDQVRALLSQATERRRAGERNGGMWRSAAREEWVPDMQAGTSPPDPAGERAARQAAAYREEFEAWRQAAEADWEESRQALEQAKSRLPFSVPFPAGDRADPSEPLFHEETSA